MDTTKMTSLERRVYGRNFINRLTRKNLAKILPQLDKYLGKKIVLVNESKSKNFLVNMPTFISSDGQSMRVHLRLYYGRLVLFQDITIRDRNYDGNGYGVTYHKNEIDLGRYHDNGILMEIFKMEDIISSNKLMEKYTAMEQLELSREIDYLENKVRELKGRLIIS